MQPIKRLFQKSKQRKTCLSENDLKGIATLMESGFSLQVSLQLLEDESNQFQFKCLQNDLLQGIPCHICFPSYTKDPYKTLLEGFLEFLPFHVALSISISFKEEKDRIEAEIRRQLYYPIFLFLSTIAGLILFNEICFPALLRMLQGFDVNMVPYHHLHLCLKRLYQCLLLAMLVFCITLCLFTLKSKQWKLYSKLYKFNKKAILVQATTILFSSYMYYAQMQNLSTIQTLQVLQTLKQPIIVEISKSIDLALQKGTPFLKTMQKANLDPLLVKFLNLSFYSNNATNLLHSYNVHAYTLLQNHLRRVMKWTKGISYAFIGGILIVVYQILMIPLTVLTTIQ